MHSHALAALSRPCFDCYDTLGANYRWWLTNEVSAILTVNIGME